MTLDEYLAEIDNNESYNRIVKSVRKYYEYLGLDKPKLPYRRVRVERLTIDVPDADRVKNLLNAIQHFGVKTLLSLQATTGIRFFRLLDLNWTDVDLDNRFVLKKPEYIGVGKQTKWYRPNPIHRDVLPMLIELQKHDKRDRVFNFGEHKVRSEIHKTGIRIAPSQLRDYFINQWRKLKLDLEIRRWLTGHNLGVEAHYLADDIREEYTKFEQAFRL